MTQEGTKVYNGSAVKQNGKTLILLVMDIGTWTLDYYPGEEPTEFNVFKKYRIVKEAGLTFAKLAE